MDEEKREDIWNKKRSREAERERLINMRSESYSNANVLRKIIYAWTLNALLINQCIYKSDKTNQRHKSFNHKRQDIPWENHPNMEDEKTNNSSSMRDRFVDNGLQHKVYFPIRDITLAVEKRYLMQLYKNNCIELSICLTY